MDSEQVTGWPCAWRYSFFVVVGCAVFVVVGAVMVETEERSGSMLCGTRRNGWTGRSAKGPFCIYFGFKNTD
jgi:hypothetical protein